MNTQQPELCISNRGRTEILNYSGRQSWTCRESQIWANQPIKVNWDNLKKVVTFKSWQKTLLVIAIESDCCGKAEFNNLMFLSDRLCLEVRPSLFLFWGVLAFPAPETLNLDLDTLTEGLVCWLKLGVSGLTMKPDRSGELGNMGIFPEREARMVTWKGKRNTKCIDNQNVQTKGLQ